MVFYNDFIGNIENNLSLNFYGSDNYSTFQKNKRKQPKDWYYNDVIIDYKFNEFGHRSKNIKELNFDDYFLFTGCSHTEGYGLELEKTYPYIVSKTLNTDYYNIALGATGIDVCEYNLITWFLKYPKKPKAVFIQWPDTSRFLGKNINYKNFMTYGTWRTEEQYTKLIYTGMNCGFFNARKKIAKELIENVINVPVFTITYANLDPIKNDTIYMPRLDYSRDLSHSGIQSHLNCSKLLVQAYEQM